MRPRTHRARLATGAALLAGCGSGDSDPAMSAGPPRRRPDAAAESTDDCKAHGAFDPQTITVKAGTEVTWTNSDDATHTATADDGSFDTGDLDQGRSKSVTFEKAGSFTYYCRFHPFMKATVEVQ
jgi:plastocyanin